MDSLILPQQEIVLQGMEELSRNPNVRITQQKAMLYREHYYCYLLNIFLGWRKGQLYPDYQHTQYKQILLIKVKGAISIKFISSLFNTKRKQ